MNKLGIFTAGIQYKNGNSSKVVYINNKLILWLLIRLYRKEFWKEINYIESKSYFSKFKSIDNSKETSFHNCILEDCKKIKVKG